MSAVVAWFAVDTLVVSFVAGTGLWAALAWRDKPDPGEWGPGRGSRDDYELAV